MKTRHGTEFNVAQLLKEPIGGRRSYEVEIPVDFEEEELRQSDSVTGTVDLLRTNSGVLVEATLDGAVTVECSRCLTDVRCPVSLDIVEEFHPTVDVVRGTFVAVEEEDAALLINEHHILDIAENGVNAGSASVRSASSSGTSLHDATAATRGGRSFIFKTTSGAAGVAATRRVPTPPRPS